MPKFAAMSFLDRKQKIIKIQSLRIVTILKRTSQPASVTLEAALILPFFMFAMLSLMSIFEALRIQSVLQAALHQAGRETAVLAFDAKFTSEIANEDMAKELSPDAEGFTSAACHLYASARAREYIRENLAGDGSIAGGISGINFLFETPYSENYSIDIIARYSIEPFFIPGKILSIPMEIRYFSHAWLGYAEGKISEDYDAGTEEIVYITQTGSAYHRDIACTYLKPTVSSTDFGNISSKRNKSGAVYYPCEACGAFVSGTHVFITDYGNRYHSKENCSKIYREIQAVYLSEVGGRHECSKCGKKH